MTRPRYLRTAEMHLSAHDPVMANLVAKIGRCQMRRHQDPFHALVGTVISQQISTKAAHAIATRLRARYVRTGLTPKDIVRAKDDVLRGCGLSSGKVRTLRALAARILAGEIDLKRLPRLSEEAVTAILLPTHGIGPWSVHMFLMFGLTRPDVLPTGDYGLRVAIKNQFGLAALPDSAEIERIAQPWRPYCTVASWYLWQSLK